MKICFIPIDNRPVCYNLAKDIAAIDKEIKLLIPPREYLGDLKKNAKVDSIIDWLKQISDCDAMILSLDTLAYGGLIPSRRGVDENGNIETFDDIKNRIKKIKPLLKGKKVYAFSSIMRISNNNYNEEEKEYWKDYGKKIFEYSFSDGLNKSNIPQEILDDYLETRKRNFEINKIYLDWQKEGLFDTLIFSKDDCAIKGFNVKEAQELEKLGGKTKTGADEIPLTLLARAIKKDIKIYPEFLEPEYKNSVSNYEDVSIEQSVLGQLELGGFKIATSEQDADIILIINNFVNKQGELVMDWETGAKYKGNFQQPQKPYAIADVRFANGADNDFIKDFLPLIDTKLFYGYSAWNTSANTLGSLLAGIKIKWNAKKYNEDAFNRLQMIRFLDDWAYQANIRSKIEEPCNINDLMQPYEDKLQIIFNFNKKISYSYPWNRKFEIEVNIN